MSKLFSENHIDDWDSRLLEMTVGQLTALFPNRPVITTNFDRVLEHAYNQYYKPFEYVLGPLSSQALITKARQTNSHVLYKVHGDIGRDSIDFGSIIFTLEQYEEFYSSDSSLVKQLSEWMSGKTLLFVGCSLGDDYTIKLLQRIVNEEEYRNGLNHFAIINCEKDNIDQRSRELGQKHILPIILPDGDYDSVRLVLKRLYEDIIYLSVFEQAAKLRKMHLDMHDKEIRTIVKSKLYQIYHGQPKDPIWADLYTDTILDELVDLDGNEQIAKLVEIEEYYSEYKNDKNAKIIYINALYHCVRRQNDENIKRDCLLKMQSLFETTEHACIKVAYLHYMILECKGFYSADELMEELGAIAFDFMDDPFVQSHVIDAQRHVGWLLDGND